MKEEKVCVSCRLTQEEADLLTKYSKLCGLSENEFMRQRVRGITPRPLPRKEFWDLLDELYQRHDEFSHLAKTIPEAKELCKEIENLVVFLQEIS